ncbi:MAG: DUF2155 domain-containing protein [Alphaproteobacteria bacterium]|nr:DUF2155 domain-containing protein [Alphaproteobacteria bacterium]
MKVLALLPLGLLVPAALAQTIPNPPAAASVPAAPAAPAADAPAGPPTPPQGGTQLTLRGLDKITGRPTAITAPIGKPVQFATLTITARFCYSTPASETPETTAFVQIEDHRPDQPPRRVFSGWMYGSSPGLNGVEHPLYDVWVISCNNAPAPALAANTSTAPVKVKAPDSSDKEGIQALPEGAGQ